VYVRFCRARRGRSGNRDVRQSTHIPPHVTNRHGRLGDMSEYPNEIPDESEQLDQLDQQRSLLDRGVDDPLDEGYSPPERYSMLIREGEHETLDERLQDEIPEPDPYAQQEEEILDDGEVGDERAGRLVDPNEGIGPDIESNLVGTDVGIDGGAASAEEAAVHIVPDDEQAG
jgi:hypothetical protein